MNQHTTSNETTERELYDAVARLIKAKGRFHTEQNYAALVKAFDACQDAAASPPIQVAPSGWKLVPAEPTYQMCIALGCKWEGAIGFPGRYRAMLDAAPVPQVAPEQAMALLRKIVDSDVGRDTLHKLGNGQGVETSDGKAWLAAKAATAGEVAPEQASVPFKLVDITSHKGWANFIYTGPDCDGLCIAMVPPFVASAIRALISKEAAPSADSAADARLVMQGMADCMDMVRGELIEAGIIGENVAPMFIANAVCARIAGSEQDAARYQWLVERFGVTRLPCFLEDSFQRGYIADGKKSIDSAIDTAMQPTTGKEPT